MKHIAYIFSITAATLIACILSTMGLSAKNRTGLSPAASVECLIERICPGASKHFFIQIDTSATESYFELAQGSDNRIIISADCPINAATGLNWYLKYYAGIHLSWNCMRADLPDTLPPGGPPGHIAPNTCTGMAYYPITIPLLPELLHILILHGLLGLGPVGTGTRLDGSPRYQPMSRCCRF